MARFDVFADPSGTGMLLDVQTDLLSGLNTRVVVPLLPRGVAPVPAERLNPVLVMDGMEMVMVTQFMAAVPLAALRTPLGTLGYEFDRITRAIDMLMQGF